VIINFSGGLYIIDIANNNPCQLYQLTLEQLNQTECKIVGNSKTVNLSKYQGKTLERVTKIDDNKHFMITVGNQATFIDIE
jgi:hypothetical protein